MTALAREGVAPEVAARVMLSVFGADSPLDLAAFRPEVWGGYIIQAERFVDALPELHPLHVVHWQETEKYRHGIAMDPDYEALAERERIGRLLQVTCRTMNGDLVGHVRMFLNRSTHTRTEYGDEDTLFLLPGHRGGLVAIRMMRYAERWLLSLGLREIRANSKLSNDAGALMRRLKYPAVATQHCRIFSAQEAAHILNQGDAAHGPDPQAPA